MCDSCCNRREFLGAAAAGGMLLATHLATRSALAADAGCCHGLAAHAPGQDLQGVRRPHRRLVSDAPDRRNRQVRKVLRRPGEETGRCPVRRRRPGAAGRRGPGHGQAERRRRAADRPPVRPRRRRAGVDQDDRRRPAHGAVHATVQRPRLDVLPAMAQAGQAGHADAHQQLGRIGPGGQPDARAGQDEAHQDPGRRQPARHGRRLLAGTSEAEAGRRTGQHPERTGAWST